MLEDVVVERPLCGRPPVGEDGQAQQHAAREQGGGNQQRTLWPAVAHAQPHEAVAHRGQSAPILERALPPPSSLR